MSARTDSIGFIVQTPPFLVYQLKGLVADVEQLNSAEGKKVAEIYELERALDQKCMDLMKRKIDILKSETNIQVRWRYQTA